MKRLFALVAFVAAALAGSSAQAQYVHVYSSPVVTVARPVVVPIAPRVVYPAPVVSYRPYVAPVVPVYPLRPRVRYFSPYGGYEVRVPGRPVANTIRTVIR